MSTVRYIMVVMVISLVTFGTLVRGDLSLTQDALDELQALADSDCPAVQG